jgi:folate-binding protein YgfZ
VQTSVAEAPWIEGATGVGPDFGGCPVPLHYGDWVSEYGDLKRSAGMVYLGGCAQIEITGPDRCAFLNRLCTNRVEPLQAGCCREALLADATGHVIAHVLVRACAESLVLCAAPGQAERILAHLDRYLIRDAVELHDRTAQAGQLLLSGPGAAGLLGGPPGGELEIAGHRAVACPLDDGPASLLVLLDRDGAGAVWQALARSGARPCGHQALAAYRIERGWPIYGVDISQANLAQEIGRDAQAICFHKGCYLGQETVARIDSRGHVNRRLAGLHFPPAEGRSGVVPLPGMELVHEGRAVGQVTSSAFSPDLGGPVALGYVRRPHYLAGTRLDSPAGAAIVVALPMTRRPLIGASGSAGSRPGPFPPGPT